MPDTAPIPAPAKRRWWHRRALWLNAIVLALAAAELHLRVIQPLLPVNVYIILAFLQPVLNAAAASRRRKD